MSSTSASCFAVGGIRCISALVRDGCEEGNCLRLPVLFLGPFFVILPKRNPKRKMVTNPSIVPIANESTTILLQCNHHVTVMQSRLPLPAKRTSTTAEPISGFNGTIRDTSGAPLARAASLNQRPGYFLRVSWLFSCPEPDLSSPKPPSSASSASVSIREAAQRAKRVDPHHLRNLNHQLPV